MTDDLYCRRCGAPLRTGLLASARRACCLNDTPIVGACPSHGPLGPHHATSDVPGDDTVASDRTPRDDAPSPPDR
ncbi:hypothetical protein [Salinigranum sp.]|uniref:hypothetical protein n=1 Tax=Salinigranum sp. TaxID=1966351 RepID=UPI003561F0D5